jgi:Fe-S oxidoreductase
MINFNLFVLPFFLGLLYVVFAIGKSWFKWVRALPNIDKVKFSSGIRNPRLVLSALYEVFMEGLIHRRMWKKNPLLGYMHMSFALGWFLLIVMGNFESRVYSGTHLNAPYYPIFLKFFIHDRLVLFFEIFTVPGFFRFIMDFLLLFVLSGLLLAFMKRKYSKWFGMKRTTEYQLTDRVALTCLWLIFPMRLLAESFTAGYYGSGGGFMTQPLGNFLVKIIPLPSDFVAYTMWWGYSLILGIFFIMLPASRYMHIPTEILLIFFRRFGIQPKKWTSSYSEVEIQSCSRCGVCIDVCQLNSAAGITDTQAVYFIRGMRDQFVREDITMKCMICGRCQEACPVGIHTDSLRLIKRREIGTGQATSFSYLKDEHPSTAEVIYFAGCMSHLTPSIPRAMINIMKQAGIDFLFLDKDGSVCCGRPLMLAGRDKQANELIEYNKKLIRQTRAKLLVTSCPICYRIFREEYNLPLRIQHHTQFLLDLVNEGRLSLINGFPKIVYHDPCDLGRGSRIFEAPRELLGKISILLEVEQEGKDALCCGGSLGLFSVTNEQKDAIAMKAIDCLIKDSPDILATACPLCKKTFAKQSKIPVMDIAELLSQSLPQSINAT